MGNAVGWYTVAVGALMTAWWTFDVRRGALTRADRTPGEIWMHLAAELTTAGLLVVGGVVLLADGGREIALVALGMLLYTVLASPGYFLARHERAPVVMFGVLSMLTVVAIALLLGD